MATRFCIVLDPIYADGTQSDLHEILRPDDPRLVHLLGTTGIESTPVLETDEPFERLLEIGLPDDARKTDQRVTAAPGYDVAPESDPFGL